MKLVRLTDPVIDSGMLIGEHETLGRIAIKQHEVVRAFVFQSDFVIQVGKTFYTPAYSSDKYPRGEARLAHKLLKSSLKSVLGIKVQKWDEVKDALRN